MDIIFPVLLFGFGLYFIVKGGNFLVDSALNLTKTSGVSPVTVGATLVAVATAIPEIFISVFAVVSGNHGIAVGNSVGTMIANFALVFGIYAVARPKAINRRELHDKIIFMLIAFAVLFLFASGMRFSFLDGMILLGLFFVFIVWSTFRKNPTVSEGGIVAETPVRDKTPLKKIIFGFIVAQIFLMLGAFLLVRNGEAIATMTGASQTVIGFSIIALGNAAPELVTVIASIKRGNGGLAMGSLIGANIINTTLLIGLCSVIGAATGDALTISAQTLWVSLPVLFGIATVAVVPVMLRGKTSRLQGVFLISLYIVYLTYLFVLQPT